MTSSEQASDVCVVVRGGNRLSEDLLVTALQRRGITARGFREDDGRGEPDVFVVDVRLIAGKSKGRARYVLMVERDDRATRRFARLAGASACVARGATADHLARTVLLAARGEDLLAPSTRTDADGFLTSRETDVLHLMAAGHDNAAIAQRLDISPHTARTHVQRILTKFDVRSRFSAVSAARGRGLLRSGT